MQPKVEKQRVNREQGSLKEEQPLMSGNPVNSTCFIAGLMGSRNACCALISVLPRTTSTDAPVSMTPLCLHLLRGCSSTTIFCLLHTTTPTPTTSDHLPPSLSANKARAQLRDCVQGKEQAQMVSETPEGLSSP